MSQPDNPAAQMIVQAQSVIRDLTTQLMEVQTSITLQQSLIDALLPAAVWAEPDPEPEPEPVPDPEVPDDGI